MTSLAKKITAALLAAFAAAVVMTGCADSKGTDRNTTPDAPEIKTDNETVIQQGTVTFYSETVDEDKEPASKKTYELKSEAAKEVAAILSGVEWISDDRLMMHFDGEIVLSDMDEIICFYDFSDAFPEREICYSRDVCYFGYDGILYYKGHIAGMTDEQVKYIRSLKPIFAW